MQHRKALEAYTGYLAVGASLSQHEPTERLRLGIMLTTDTQEQEIVRCKQNYGLLTTYY